MKQCRPFGIISTIHTCCFDRINKMDRIEVRISDTSRGSPPTGSKPLHWNPLNCSLYLGCVTKASLTIFCDSPRMGQQQFSPGQSAATPWVWCPPTRDCPEGAKLVGMGRMCRNRLFGPFRAMGVARGCVPSAALRFALGCYV